MKDSERKKEMEGEIKRMDTPREHVPHVVSMETVFFDGESWEFNMNTSETLVG